MEETNLYNVAQRKVISLLMRGSIDDYGKSTQSIDENSFADLKYRYIYRAIGWLHDHESPVNVISILQTMQVTSDIKGIQHSNFLEPNGINHKGVLDEILKYSDGEEKTLEMYIGMLADKFSVSKMEEFAGKLITGSMNGSMTTEKIRNMIVEYSKFLYDETDRNQPRTLQQIASAFEKKIADGDKYSNSIIRTGITTLDKHMWLTPTNTTVIGADSSHGKTSLAMQIAWNVSKQQKILVDNVTGISIPDSEGNKQFTNRTVLIFSLEMNEEELLTKLMCISLNKSYQEFELETPMDEKLRAVGSFRKSVLDICPNLIIDCKSMSLDEIANKCRVIKSIYGSIDLVIIDYIQLIENVQSTNKNKREDSLYREISRFLKKNIAGKLETHVIALSQLRNPDTDKAGNPIYKPTVHRLFGSSAFRQDASNVVLVFREWACGISTSKVVSKSEGTIDISSYFVNKIILAKNRMGELSIEFALGFIPYLTYFTSLGKLRQLGIDLKSQGASAQKVDISEEFMRKIGVDE